MSSEKVVAVRVRKDSKKRMTETWSALNKAFSLAYDGLTNAEKARVRRVVKLAGVACGQDTSWQTDAEEVFE